MRKTTAAVPCCARCGFPESDHVKVETFRPNGMGMGDIRYICPTAVFEAELPRPTPFRVCDGCGEGVSALDKLLYAHGGAYCPECQAAQRWVKPAPAPELIDAVTCKGCGGQFPRAVAVYAAWLNSYFCHACHVNRFAAPEPAPIEGPLPPDKVVCWKCNRRVSKQGAVYLAAQSVWTCWFCYLNAFPAPEPAPAPTEAFPRHYSGDLSEGFWEAVKALPEGPWHEATYLAGCALQDIEGRVLQMLRDGLGLEPERVEADVKPAITQEPLPPVDWRRCPECGQAWPHPSVRSEMRCWPCAVAKAKNDGDRDNARLLRQVRAVRGLTAGWYFAAMPIPENGQWETARALKARVDATLDAAAREPGE